MCGIIGGFDTRPKASVNEWVINQFEDQHDRGTKGFGLIGWNSQSQVNVKRACEPAKFMFDLHARQWPMLIAHHRQPTASDNLLSQTHPILVSNDCLEFDYLVVHNGVISNDDELKAKHEALGFDYTTEHRVIYLNSEETKFNDSECVAIEVARYIEHHTTVCETLGSMAFIALQINKKTQKVNRICFGRNTSPLNMAKTRHEMYLSSEGKGDPIRPNVLYECQPKGTMELSQRTLHFAVAPPKQTAIGYHTPSQYLSTGSKLAHSKSTQDLDDYEWGGWRETEDYQPTKTDSERGVMFAAIELDKALEDVTLEVEEFLDGLDSEASAPYMSLDYTLNSIRKRLEAAQADLLLKYDSIPRISEQEGDTGGETGQPGAGQAVSSGLEKTLV